MPKKGKKKGGEKGKGKKGGKKTAAKAAAAAEAEEMLKVCKKFVKSYQLQCGSAGSVPSHRILRDIRACVENERPLPKVATGTGKCGHIIRSCFLQFILDVQVRSQKIVPKSTTRKKKLAASVSPTEAKAREPPPTLAVEGSASGASASAETPEADGSTGPQLEPLVNTFRELNYPYLRCFHVWNLPQSDEAIVALVSSVHSYSSSQDRVYST